MPFMLLTLAVVIVITVVAFFQTSPRVAERRKLVAFNVATLVLALPVAIAVGAWLYADAVTVKAAEKGMAVYLTIIAGATAGLLVIAVGGMIRNFAIFPRGKRLPPPADEA